MRFFILSFVFIFWGCVKEPYNLSFNEFPIEPDTSKLNYQERCNVKVNPIIDERPFGNHLGNLGTRLVKADDSLSWTEKFFSTLESSNHKQMEQIVLNISLKKLYITSIHSQRIGNVVLLVNFNKGELDKSKLYRGTDIVTLP